MYINIVLINWDIEGSILKYIISIIWHNFSSNFSCRTLMPIPHFDLNFVLPPHIGNPTEPNDVSPYKCDTLELCHRFATTKERTDLLKYLLSFRARMDALNINHGIQWVNGSFCEDIESSESRSPRDIDVVTYYNGTVITPAILTSFPEFSSPTLSKTNFFLDHYPVDFTHDPFVTINMTRYWIQLFCHKRNLIWKGILELSLNTPREDRLALDYLNTLFIV